MQSSAKKEKFGTVVRFVLEGYFYHLDELSCFVLQQLLNNGGDGGVDARVLHFRSATEKFLHFQTCRL